MIAIDIQKQLQTGTATLALNIQMQIAQGAMVSLLGSSGTGKTTLLRMLAGLSRPDGGHIIVNDQVWFDANTRMFKPPQARSVGMVFQDYALFPNLSVADNIAYALNKTDTRQLAHLLEITGLSALSQRLPGSLSGGQKQRVALARALARVMLTESRILLLDEPLSALDEGLRHQLQDELLSLHRQFGLTTILVSHDVGEVFKLAQQVYCLEAGRIARQGTPAEIFLHQQVQGKLNLQAQVLAIRQEEVVYVLSLLVGQEIVDIIASASEVTGLNVGDRITMSAKAFSPLIFKQPNG
ncbi:ABC transporter ATP-binding protein [Undibacterium sp. SXout7W]|uniref:ABC transporter ATP-binding protein n=1 Tax=Undibacterium sp. SXout7W TaxID=3413049 RepID=UPI003BEF6230